MLQFTDMGKSAKRLIEYFKPEHYDLSLEPDNEKLTFKGQVTIRGRVTGKPSQRITFHKVGLKISSAEIKKLGKAEEVISVDRINTQASLHEVRLHSTQKLFPGLYEVTMKFSGKITPAMVGMYPSRFTHEGKEKTILTTQFESHHARKAFPCIDEPEAKATFQLSLTTPPDLVVLSNTEPEKKEKAGDKVTHTFEKTPIMSTYLLAFVIGELHCAEGKTSSGIKVRSWASLAQDKTHLEYSVTEAIKTLEFFAEYFDSPYPLNKCDQVALPDFDAGAMENWGLITYREVVLLADPVNRSISSEQYVSMVIAHELSHQWFGNLVTMKWWDDLWLNESFASLMEHVALNSLHPDWQQWEHCAAEDFVATSSRDIYKDVQAVSVEVVDPDLIESLFDPGIVYAKGCRLLKMLLDFIGEDALRKGLKQYFDNHAYGNATREDLWKALGNESHVNISELMSPWLLQSGMPLLIVEQNEKKLKVSQERFLLDAADTDKTWPVPYLALNPLKTPLLTKRSETLELDKSDFVVLNSPGSGHYVTFYKNPEHRAAITNIFTDLPTEARINILNDNYLLARHGDLPLSAGLDVVLANSNEPRDNVWGLMVRLINAAYQLVDGNEQHELAVKKLKRTLALPHYKELGWDDKSKDDSNTKQLRHTMVALMVGSEDQEAMEQAYSLFKQSKKLSEINAELRSSILVACIRLHPEEIIDKLMSEYPEATADIQMDIAAALTAAKDPKDITRIYAHMLGTKGLVRPQDLMRWLALGLRNSHARDIVWEFMQTQWDWIYDTLKQSKYLDYLPIYVASVGSTEEWLKSFEQFFADKDSIKVLRQNISVGLGDIKARVEWRKRDEQSIVDWLSQNVK